MIRFRSTLKRVLSTLLAIGALVSLLSSLRLAAAPATARPETPPPSDAIHQLRIYEIFEHNKAAFHERFRAHAMRIMRERYGFDFVALWETQSDDRTEFVYLLRWPDAPTMKAQWTAFMADEEWKEIKRRTAAVHGQLVGEIQERVLQPTAYSPVSATGTALP
ncbi:MAG TPA: NIPSNAP family protein [Opitutaceae bacterium]